MHLKYSIRTLLFVALIAALGFVLYQRTIGRDPIRRTNSSTWFDHGIGVAERVHTGAWDHHDVIWGPGSHLTLDQSAFDTRTFDGGSSLRASFQMPQDASPGDIFDFAPIPVGRVSVTIPSEYSDTYTFMLPGEFTAFQFGNPFMDWMPSTSESTARVRILAMTDDVVRVHVTMHAVLPDFMDLDLDREFTIKRQSTEPK
ncbi:MAG: hypothetical protein AAGG48_31920 [Planctomycetota bacterium]